MISMAFHHGLRAIELVRLRWSDVNFKANDIAINRRKNGRSNRQPLDPADQRNLKALCRDRKSDEWIFTSERGTRMATDSFASQLAVAADRIGMVNVHPHALRHACGHALAVWVVRRGCSVSGSDIAICKTPRFIPMALAPGFVGFGIEEGAR